jgi:hypothetical protein
MPNYNAASPPPAIYPGDVVHPFDAESPAAPQASQQYAVAGAYDGAAGGPSELRVDLRYASAPSAVSVQVQSSINDADADYVTEATSTNTAGESIKLTNFRGRFVRVLLESQTGGGAITATLQR